MKKVRGKSLICMAIILMVISLVPINFGYADASPNVYLDPADPVYNPGESFTLDINVSNAPEIEGWQVKLRWDPGILYFPKSKEEAADMIKEGPFVNDTGPTEFRMAAPNLVERYVLFVCHKKDNVTAPSGNGTLANVTFTVTESGVTDITLLEVKLFAFPDGGTVPNVTTTDAYFTSTKPFVDFDWTPVSPEINETATFNASACFDPGGSNGNITLYSWNWGDGTSNVTANPVITHEFGGYNNTGWLVNLTVTDDDAETYSKAKSLRMWHDISSLNIWPTLTYLDSVDFEINWCQDHELGILLTCVNEGTYTDTFNVTLYADLNTTVIGDEYVGWQSYDWDGTILERVYYQTITLAPGEGSAWELWFYFDMYLIWEAGNYTLTLVADTVPGETTTANNVFTASTLLSVTTYAIGDVNCDGIVNIQDVVIVALAFGATTTQPNIVGGEYSHLADLNRDGEIDIVDIVMLAINFGS